jgi:hypothetical protein
MVYGSALIVDNDEEWQLVGSLSTAVEVGNVEPPIGFGEESLAVVTEEQRGPVELLEPVRGAHDTLRPLIAVNEGEGMSQFVNGHLGGAFIQDVERRLSAIFSDAKAVK